MPPKSAKKEELDQINAGLLMINNKLDAVVKQLTNLSEEVRELKLVKEQFTELRDLILEDTREKEIKNKQIVLFNMQEGTPEEDRAKVDRILSVTGVKEKAKFMRRIGRPKEDGSIRPLTVGFYRTSTCEDALCGSHKLKNDAIFSDIRITKDLTKLQQKAHKDLQEEMNRRNATKNEEGVVWKIIGRRGEGRLMKVRSQ